MSRRLPPRRYSTFWPSAVVLLALLGVLAEIRNVHRARRPAEVASVLRFHQLTYVADPLEEPRRLTLELADRELPLALRENHAAQVSPYRPARTGHESPSLVSSLAHGKSVSEHGDQRARGGEPVPADESANHHDADESANQPERTAEPGPSVVSDALPLHLFSPGEWELDAILPSRETFGDEMRRFESDAIDDDLLRLIPSAYPARSDERWDSTFSSEIKSSYVVEDDSSRIVEDMSLQVVEDESLHVAAATSLQVVEEEPRRAVEVRAEERIFAAPPPEEDPQQLSSATETYKTYWSPTKWARTTADHGPRAAANGGLRLVADQVIMR